MASTEVRLYVTPSELREGARLALKHRLYVIGWGLQQSLSFLTVARFTCKDQLALVFVDGEPVAIALHEERHRQVQCFVRKAHRRNGYGTMAVNELRFDRNEVFADEGLKGTRGFWHSSRVRIRTHRL